MAFSSESSMVSSQVTLTSDEITVLGNTTDLEKGSVNSSQDEKAIEGPGNAYSIFTTAEKRLITVIIALSTLLPPLTSSIYYPVIPMLANDFAVSVSAINLTITSYLIIQGIAPSFIGNLSDESGRRPALVISITIYIVGCIGAALKGSYALLMVMRCIQSAGSSGTIALSLAAVSDIVTSAQRGRYTSYVQMGWMVGPALGPVIGGLLGQYMGWRAMFWFLTVFGSLVLIIVLMLLPETSRMIVGNGSFPAQEWNMPLLAYLRTRRQHKACDDDDNSTSSRNSLHTGFRAQLLNPLSSLKLFLDKESAILLFYSGLIYASSYMVLSSLPDQLQEKYGFNTLQISLCYLATGLGSMTSVLLVGRLLDWNFRRYAESCGIEISNNKQQDLSDFPVEAARLQISLPLLLLGAISLVAYGWTMQARTTTLAAPVIFLFLQSFGNASSFAGFNSLIMDLNRSRPGTASAAMNLARCWMGAAGVAFAKPLNSAGGVGWMTVTIAGAWLVFSPAVFLVVRYGPAWREEKRLKDLESSSSM